MKKVPLWCAILFEIALIWCHDYFEQPYIWYVIGINGAFIIHAIFRIIYEKGSFSVDLDWLFDIDLRSFIFVIALIIVIIWLFLCFIGVCEFRV